MNETEGSSINILNVATGFFYDPLSIICGILNHITIVSWSMYHVSHWWNWIWSDIVNYNNGNRVFDKWFFLFQYESLYLKTHCPHTKNQVYNQIKFTFEALEFDIISFLFGKSVCFIIKFGRGNSRDRPIFPDSDRFRQITQHREELGRIG